MNTLRNLFLPLLVARIGGVSAQSTATDSTRIPVIEIEPLVLMDTIRLDSGNGNRTYLYHLRNTGNAPLIIRSVQSGDPCFCSKWPNEPVLPGGRVELEVRCPPARSGPKQQWFTIGSNAGKDAIFRLKRYGLP